jgi:hypothetical protein
MTTPHSLPPGSTQDPDRPHVFWYPRGERHEVRFVVKPDPRDAKLERLTTALRHIRTLAGDWLTMEAWTDDVFAAIHKLATDALAGAEPEPAATVEEAMAI